MTPGPKPSCTCGACSKCRNRLNQRKRTILPTTFEQAVEARKHSAGLLMWPHIQESIRTLEESFPHLRNTQIGDPC